MAGAAHPPDHRVARMHGGRDDHSDRPLRVRHDFVRSPGSGSGAVDPVLDRDRAASLAFACVGTAPGSLSGAWQRRHHQLASPIHGRSGWFHGGAPRHDSQEYGSLLFSPFRDDPGHVLPLSGRQHDGRPPSPGAAARNRAWRPHSRRRARVDFCERHVEPRRRRRARAPRWVRFCRVPESRRRFSGV